MLSMMYREPEVKHGKTRRIEGKGSHIMFFGKQEKEMLSRIQTDCGANARLMESAGDRIEALEKAAGKHDVVLEDLSDTLAELREQETDVLAQLHEELDLLREERLQAEQKDREKLMTLLMEYENHLLSIEFLLSENEEWKKQFALIHQKLKQKSLAAGVVLLGEEGEPVDYEVHEVIDVRKTDRMERDHRVAQVYERGCQYHGMIRKARVSVWKGIKE